MDAPLSEGSSLRGSNKVVSILLSSLLPPFFILQTFLRYHPILSSIPSFLYIMRTSLALSVISPLVLYFTLLCFIPYQLYPEDPSFFPPLAPSYSSVLSFNILPSPSFTAPYILLSRFIPSYVSFLLRSHRILSFISSVLSPNIFPALVCFTDVYPPTMYNSLCHSPSFNIHLMLLHIIRPLPPSIIHTFLSFPFTSIHFTTPLSPLSCFIVPLPLVLPFIFYPHFIRPRITQGGRDPGTLLRAKAQLAQSAQCALARKSSILVSSLQLHFSPFV